jgi:hypothetical protein
VKAGEGVRFAKNRRVVVRVRGLPREQVTAEAYKALGLTDPADRSQPFSKILFAYDRTRLDGPEAFAILDTWAAIIAENPDILVSVTSSSGTDGASAEYAIRLGGRRTAGEVGRGLPDVHRCRCLTHPNRGARAGPEPAAGQGRRFSHG